METFKQHMDAPNSWKVVRLGDFVENEKGKKPKSQQDNPSDSHSIPYIDIEAFEEGVLKSWTNGEGCRLCSEKDFLMVWDGSRSGLVGKGMNGALGSTLVRINFPQIENHYAYYFLQSKFLEINTRAKGSGTPHVDPDILWNYEFPIPPENEQRRIVSKIEELFSELNSGIESLKTAREQLKVYRQALLKHAFEGKLTADWREQNKDKLETADQLLVRIRTEREARYQQQLTDWKAAVKAWETGGKKGKKPSKPRCQVAPTSYTKEELRELSELPVEWEWVKFGEVFSVFVGATPSRKILTYWGGSINWVSSGEVGFCRISETKETITEEGLENTSTECHPPNTVMLGMIGEGKTRGQTAILDTYACHNQNTAAIRVGETPIPSEFVYYFLMYRYEITRLVGSGNNQKALNKERVSNLPLPLPPVNEQYEILKEIEQNLSIVDQIEIDLDINLKKLEALRQSISKKAFSGNLVPQDPNDEPASVLLERIKAEKATQSALAKKSKRKKIA